MILFYNFYFHDKCQFAINTNLVTQKVIKISIKIKQKVQEIKVIVLLSRILIKSLNCFSQSSEQLTHEQIDLLKSYINILFKRVFLFSQGLFIINNKWQ